MPLAPIKIIFTVFALFAWSRAYLTFKKRSISVKELIFWTFIWVMATIIVFIPGKTAILARLLGMGRGFDALTFMSIMVLFYIVYRLYVRADENDQVITELTRQLALKNAIKPKRKKKK